jgi:hypothetical protein
MSAYTALPSARRETEARPAEPEVFNMHGRSKFALGAQLVVTEPNEAVVAE